MEYLVYDVRAPVPCHLAEVRLELSKLSQSLACTLGPYTFPYLDLQSTNPMSMVFPVPAAAGNGPQPSL